jgi:hypothetical protein
LQDPAEDRDLDVIVSVTYHSKQPLKHLWEGTHVTGRSLSDWLVLVELWRVAGAVLAAL